MDKELDPFQEGLRLLREGELKPAILAFEAAVQKDFENAEAWRYLGQAQAENEQESPAIAALLNAIKIDPYNLPALMMLGVSYTNDLEENNALNYLKTWLMHNPNYQGSALSEHLAQVEEYEQFYGSSGSGPFDSTRHDEVTKMFLKATEINPNDAELYTVLGVLYHISNDYPKAIESFKTAVRLSPNDAQLWNKLGATQANASMSAEAVHAYKRALQLRPKYVRSLCNLAIAYANQGKHEDAVRTYLSVLGQNSEATHVWNYLRISLSHLNRPELLELTNLRDVDAFRPHFTF